MTSQESTRLHNLHPSRSILSCLPKAAMQGVSQEYFCHCWHTTLVLYEELSLNACRFETHARNREGQFWVLACHRYRLQWQPLKLFVLELGLLTTCSTFRSRLWFFTHDISRQHGWSESKVSCWLWCYAEFHCWQLSEQWQSQSSWC